MQRSPSSSSSYASYQAPPHPQQGGKGLPPSFFPDTHSAHSHSHPGPPPDLTQRYKLKAKYHKLQKNYHRGLEARKDLAIELAEKEAKVQQLQDEVDLILDQIHSSDYAHLRPLQDDLFSDDDSDLSDDRDGKERVKGEDGEDGERPAKRGKTRTTLDELEDARRREFEHQRGIDGSLQNATLPPIDPAFAQLAAASALPPLASSFAPEQLQHLPPPPPLPATAAAGSSGLKLKLKFGGGGGPPPAQ